MFLRREQRAQLLFPDMIFWQRDVLPSDESSPRGLIDSPGKIGRREDEHAGGITFAGRGHVPACSRALEIRPLNEELRLDAPGGFVFRASAAC